MKKQLTAMVLIFGLLLTMPGCSAVRILRKLDTAEEVVEDRLDAAEDRLEDRFLEAAAPAPTDAPSQTPPANRPAQLLTEDQVLQIALDYLGFTADQVTRLRTDYEIDDGIPQFDVEFHQGDWEYEFEIHGEDGRILSFDKDYR